MSQAASASTAWWLSFAYRGVTFLYMGIDNLFYNIIIIVVIHSYAVFACSKLMPS